jgi:hypothetical protein
MVELGRNTVVRPAVVFAHDGGPFVSYDSGSGCSTTAP